MNAIPVQSLPHYTILQHVIAALFNNLAYLTAHIDNGTMLSVRKLQPELFIYSDSDRM